MVAAAPDPVLRPKLARFIWERSLRLRDVADALDCSTEQVRLITLPFADPARRVPAGELVRRIVQWTEGAVRPADFYPPELTGEPGSLETRPAEVRP